MELKSRILKYINKDLMIRLNSIALDVLIPDNNTKVDLMVAAFEEHNVPFSELGPGTNRYAVLIDGYVFKIGMDKAGIIDNWAEFSLSQELQPFVTKCYECNGLIAVAEYVTVISKEEFQNSKDEVRQILSHFADSYLLGDVGSITKNFMNWGYRSDGSLVILDFAYIYRVIGEELMCGALKEDDTTCSGILEYDINFHKLICPVCRKEYTFHEIRRKISREYEEKERDVIKQIAYKLTQPSQQVNKSFNNPDVIKNEKIEGELTMKKNNYDYCNDFNNESTVEFDEDSYADAIEFMMNVNNMNDNESEEEKEDLYIDLEKVEEEIQILDESDDISNIEVDEDEENVTESDTCNQELNPVFPVDIKLVTSSDYDYHYVTTEIDSFDDDNITEEELTELPEPIENIDKGSIVSMDEADDPYEEMIEESVDNNTSVYHCTSQVLNSDRHDNNISHVEALDNSVYYVGSTPTVIENININTTGNIDAINIESGNDTVKIEAGNDTVILTTPDNVDEMRAMLFADLDEKYSEYEDQYSDGNQNFQKFSKKKRDFE